MDKKDLIKEEVSRYKRILEYSFYDDSDLDIPMNEDDEEISDDEIDNMGDDISNDLESDPSNDGESDSEEEVNLNDIEPESEPEGNDLNDIEPEPEGEDLELGGDDNSDEVELDVTELVNGTDEAKLAADSAKLSSDEANAKMNDLLKMVNHLESKLSSMDNISNKIDSLGKEIVKRAPTPNEKMNLRVMDSYPYNMKLTDFWEDKDGDGGYVKKEPEEEEFVLTRDEINATYSDSTAKQSIDNPYSEDEI